MTRKLAYTRQARANHAASRRCGAWCIGLLVGILVGFVTSRVSAQPPEVGYVFPPGVSAGSTVEVDLGGYDWTPDTEFYVHDPRIKVELLGKPGPMLVPKPPYWFGPRARGPAFLIPREVRARLTIPSDMSAGVVTWQVANANGASSLGRFVVSRQRERVEVESRTGAQAIPKLPVVINGRLRRIEEVDRYVVTAQRTGPITCVVQTKELGSSVKAVLRVHDATGKLVADAADTRGRGLAVTFHAKLGVSYTFNLHDLDFRGNRAHTYRLALSAGPRVVTAVPAAGQRGQTQDVTFIGYGVATGQAKLETITKRVAFPNDTDIDDFEYALKTDHGESPPIRLSISDHAESVVASNASAAHLATLPQAVTGVLHTRDATHTHTFDVKKGDTWSIQLSADSIGSPLDVSLAILDPSGKQVVANDDANGSTDSALTFTAKADGRYTAVVSDLAGQAGRADATYRLAIERPSPGFTLLLPTQLNAPIAGKADLSIKVARVGGYQGAIELNVVGLPKGVTVPNSLVVPAKKSALKVPIKVDASSASSAASIVFTARADVDGKMIESTHRILLARTMSPPATVTPVDKDGGRTVHRGTTYPAPVIVNRVEGFTGEVVLQMAAKQGRHRQGIDGNDVVVPPGVTRTVYPVYCPEWLETDRTSRMVVNAVTRVPDPTGKVRYVSSKMVGRITMSLEGALLKVNAAAPSGAVQPGDAIDLPVTIAKSPKLSEAVRLELITPEALSNLISAEPISVNAAQTVLKVTTAADRALIGERQVTVRAVAMRDGKYATVSQSAVTIVFESATNEASE